MLTMATSINSMLGHPCIDTKLAHSAYAKKEDLQIVVEAHIENYETEFSHISFQDLLNKSIKQSPHKSTGPLLDKLIEAVRFKFKNTMKLKLYKELPKLWNVYQNGLISGFLEASDQPPILILGTKELRNSSKLIHNFNFLSDESGKTGCIFGGNWSLLKNDLVILSAIHAHKVVMLFLPQGFMANCLWNSEKSRPSMLCREISILHAAGYRRLSYPYENQLGYVLTSRNPERANGFTLTDVTRCSANINPEFFESVFFSSQTGL